MQAKDIVQDIRKAVASVKEQKQEVISVSALEQYLDELERHVDQTEEINKLKLETNLANFRAAHERNIARYQAQRQYDIEILKSVLTYAQTALKSIMIINGGAAAGLLAFIGKIWTNTSITQSAVNALTSSITLYAFGLLIGAVGTGSAYLTQSAHDARWNKTAIGLRILTVILVIASYGLFGVATYKAYMAFVVHLSHR